MPAGQRGSLSTRGTAVRRWRDSFPATAANRFHKELRFFFSLLKKKKQKKKRVRVALVLHGNASHEDYTPQKSPGGANRRLVRRNATLFTLEIGA